MTFDLIFTFGLVHHFDDATNRVLASILSEIATGRLFPVEITDMAPLRRQIVVARRRDAGEMSPAAAAFLRTLDELRSDEERSLTL